MIRDFERSANRDFSMSQNRNRGVSLTGRWVTELFTTRFAFLPWRFPDVNLTSEQLELATKNPKRYRRMRVVGVNPNGIPSGGGPGVETAFKTQIVQWSDDFESPLSPIYIPFNHPEVTTESTSGGGWPSPMNIGGFTKTLSELSCSYVSGGASVNITLEDPVEIETDLEQIYNFIDAISPTPAPVPGQILITPYYAVGDSVIPTPENALPLPRLTGVLPPANVGFNSGVNSTTINLGATGIIQPFARRAVNIYLRSVKVSNGTERVWTYHEGGTLEFTLPIEEISCGAELLDGILRPPPKELFTDGIVFPNASISRLAFPSHVLPRDSQGEPFLIPSCAPDAV